MVGINTPGDVRDRVFRLMQERDRIESEIQTQSAVLATNNNVGMHEPLVDDQGFPRNDIDVYNVRHARHRIICLQNDHKAIMKRIEQGIAEVHSFLRSHPQPDGSATTSQINGHALTNGHGNGHGQGHSNGHGNGYVNGHSNGVPMDYSTINNVSSAGDVLGINNSDHGFATIGFVHNGSPADLGGICEGDEVLRFGSINTLNFTNMGEVMDVVGRSIGQDIRVTVRRNHSIINLTVNPRAWEQPGLLGCQILMRNN